MLKPNLVWISLIVLIFVPQDCNARKCEPSSCGSIVNITNPFRLKNQPRGCGAPNYELVCDSRNETILLYQNTTFKVKEINYDNQTIRLADPNLTDDKCSAFALPHYSLMRYVPVSYKQVDFSDFLEMDLDGYVVGGDYFYFDADNYLADQVFSIDKYDLDDEFMYYLKCSMRLNNSKIYFDFSNCTNTSTQYYYYAYYGYASDDGFPEDCFIEAAFPFRKYKNFTGDFLSDVYNDMVAGFELEFWTSSLQSKRSLLQWFIHLWTWYTSFIRTYRSNSKSGFFHRVQYSLEELERHQKRFVKIVGSYIAIRILFGYLFLISLIVYKCRRKHFSIDDSLEEFIRSQNNFMPTRYKYSHIKTMTHGFKDKLGQGGFGSVFKGKLRSGHLVAVKVLANTKAKGQDFISEVATIGRIHHVNVVRLVGYCIEGSKQALVYEFMPNGSLDGVIFSKETNINLSWQKTYEIVVGVAKGIEYLHKGCDMQILHFDIKPHNILLDKNFTPKLSDFGLARLYPTNVNTVHLTAVQGTRGYIAPELFYKNIGGVSNKADVYSFGMMLIEMVSGRKNLNPRAEQPSQVYFPGWIYERFEQGEEMEFEECTEEDEKKMVKKMVIVAFWCIQMRPVDRPSMSKVMEMLEGEIEVIEMPPKPFTQPPLETIKEDIISILSNDTTTITAR